MKQTNNNRFLDSNDILSLDLQARKLYDSSGLEVLDWASGSTSFSPAKVRTLYLIPDAADVTGMGGATNNVYSTFQAVYDAAVTLRAGLGGGTQEVLVICGKCTATQVGNLTITASFDGRIKFIGQGINNTELGNIIATNASGSGYNIGAFSVASAATFIEMKIGTITTSATGTTGNGGSVFLFGYNLQVGHIDTSITNVANTTGIGGSFRCQFNQNSNIIGGNITTSSQGTNVNAGDILITARNTSFFSIQGANNNKGGTINISSGTSISSLSASYNSNATTAPAVLLTDVSIGTNITITRDDDKGDSFDFIRCNTTGASVITITNANATQFTLNITDCLLGRLTTNANVKSIISNCTFRGDGTNSTITSLGNNSYVDNCIIDNATNTTVATINGIGTSVKFINSNVYDGFRSILNGGTSTSIISINSTFERRTESNITIKGILSDAATITWDVSLYEIAEVTIDGNRTLSIINPVEGKTYRLKVIQGSGGGAPYTLAIPDGCLVPTTITDGFGLISLSTIAGDVDLVYFEYDGVNFFVRTSLLLTGNGNFYTNSVYSEPFGNNGLSVFGFPYYKFPSGWTNPGSPYDAVNDWDIYGDSDIIPFCTVTGSSGGPFVIFVNANAALEDTVSAPFSTIGYTNLKLGWNGFRSSTGPPPTLEVYWSDDNSTWNVLSFTDVANDDAWHALTPIDLPAGAENKATIYIKWETTGDASGNFFALDDVYVTGRP